MHARPSAKPSPGAVEGLVRVIPTVDILVILTPFAWKCLEFGPEKATVEWKTWNKTDIFLVLFRTV